jgi:hypothetical protein
LIITIICDFILNPFQPRTALIKHGFHVELIIDSNIFVDVLFEMKKVQGFFVLMQENKISRIIENNFALTNLE